VSIPETALLNEAGVSQSQLIRYKDGMIQSIGGWVNYGTLTSPSTVRDIHAWQTANNDKFLGIGATANLLAIFPAPMSGWISPHRPPPITSSGITFSITAGSNVVTITDANSGADVVAVSVP